MKQVHKRDDLLSNVTPCNDMLTSSAFSRTLTSLCSAYTEQFYILWSDAEFGSGRHRSHSRPNSNTMFIKKENKTSWMRNLDHPFALGSRFAHPQHYSLEYFLIKWYDMEAKNSSSVHEWESENYSDPSVIAVNGDQRQYDDVCNHVCRSLERDIRVAH